MTLRSYFAHLSIPAVMAGVNTTGFILLANYNAAAMQAVRDSYITIPFDRVITYSGGRVGINYKLQVVQTLLYSLERRHLHGGQHTKYRLRPGQLPGDSVVLLADMGPPTTTHSRAHRPQGAGHQLPSKHGAHRAGCDPAGLRNRPLFYHLHLRPDLSVRVREPAAVSGYGAQLDGGGELGFCTPDHTALPESNSHLPTARHLQRRGEPCGEH